MSLHHDRYRGELGAVLNYLCPICDGEGGRSNECLCDGLGVLTEARALELCADGWKEPVKLAPPPASMPRRCVDCAFRPDSPERENFAAMVQVLELVDDGVPFFCHQGMHTTADGRYIPQRTDEKGAPVGHPICAGWAAARAKLDRKETNAR